MSDTPVEFVACGVRVMLAIRQPTGDQHINEHKKTILWNI